MTQFGRLAKTTRLQRASQTRRPSTDVRQAGL
jgi:hypothetical protein